MLAIIFMLREHGSLLQKTISLFRQTTRQLFCWLDITPHRGIARF